ncbi:hypothetical protein FRC02_010318 [Tulasnella sp. 418]|nr:hypothetical protein FRC02_010318 [Tulasnella sp. 418]
MLTFDVKGSIVRSAKIRKQVTVFTGSGDVGVLDQFRVGCFLRKSYVALSTFNVHQVLRQKSSSSIMAALSRPLDKAYLVYFAMVFIFGICVDLQDFWPQQLLPQILKDLRAMYFRLSNDPLCQYLMGNNAQMAWFNSFMYLELLFQLPASILAIRGLLKGNRTIYLLMILYGVSTATTVLPCLATFLAVPSHEMATSVDPASLTSGERLFLLANYIPFFIFPLIMAVDCTTEVAKDMKVAKQVTGTAKAK